MLRVKKMRIEMNHDGFAQLLSSPEVTADIERRTAAIAAAAGEGFEHEVKVGRRHKSTRAVGMVWAATAAARQAEAENRVLTSAIGGAQ